VLNSLTFEMPGLAIGLKRFYIQSIHHEHNQQLIIKMTRFGISVSELPVIELSAISHNEDFMQLKYEKVVSEMCECKLGSVDINMSSSLLSPVLKFISEVMSMGIIKE
jgi:hypothetical protein